MIWTSLLIATLSSTSTATAGGAPIDGGSLASVAELGRVRRYALILGVNQPAKAGQRPLRFADDDAVRFYELFRQLPGQAALFTLLDEETQRLFPEVVAEAELPKKEPFLARAEAMFARMREDRSQGLIAELYLIYSGHGFVDDHGEGHLGLGDDTFSRGELYTQILDRSPAAVNHLIVDACDAYFFVQSRGDDPDVEALLHRRAQEFLDRQSLSRYPNTGAILSTASAAETHEWSEIRGGVFSHEVRSALLGAADANGDGLVGYQELEAFVLAANLKVQHAGATREVFVRAPDRDLTHPVLALSGFLRAHRLSLQPSLSGRIAVQDGRGRRYADLHKASGFGLMLLLLPGSQYFVRVGEVDYAVPTGEPVVALASLSAAPPSVAERGTGIAVAYEKGLFAVPFGPQLVDGFHLGLASRETELLAPVDRHPLRAAAVVSGGGAVVLGALATAFFVAGQAAYDDYNAFFVPERPGVDSSAPAVDLVELRRREAEVQAWDTRSSFALGSAVALGATAGTLLLLDALGVGR